MKDVLIILFILLLLVVSLVTHLFQSVPSMDLDQVFSAENVLLNLGLLVLVVAVFAAIYLVRHFVRDRSKKRTKGEKAIEGLVILVLGCLIVGFALVLGLPQQIPLLRETGIGHWFSKERIVLNSIVVVGVTLLAALSYWIRAIIWNPYDDDEED